MKKAIAKLTVCLLLLTVPGLAQGQIEKTLVKSFNLKGSQSLVLDLDGDVEVVTWKNKVVRIQMTIGLETGSNAMLKSLIKAGRYNLNGIVDDEGFFVVDIPQIHKEITVGGQPLSEEISYIVHAPEHVSVRMAGDASTQTETETEEDTSSL